MLCQAQIEHIQAGVEDDEYEKYKTQFGRVVQRKKVKRKRVKTYPRLPAEKVRTEEEYQATMRD